jgi:hypothetical protein
MKKLLIIGLLVMSGISFGQEKEENSNIQKGTWNFDLSVSIYATNSDVDEEFVINESNETNLSFYPSVGYAIKDNLIVGIGIGYGSRDYNYKDIETGFDYGQSRNDKTYSAYAFVKKIIPLRSNFTLNFRGELGYSNLKEEYYSWSFDNNETTNTTKNSIFVGIRPSITYFLSEYFALEGTFGTLRYDSSISEVDGESSKLKSNSFYFSLNPSNIRIGISYYL